MGRERERRKAVSVWGVEYGKTDTAPRDVPTVGMKKERSERRLGPAFLVPSAYTLRGHSSACLDESSRQ